MAEPCYFDPARSRDSYTRPASPRQGPPGSVVSHDCPGPPPTSHPSVAAGPLAGGGGEGIAAGPPPALTPVPTPTRLIRHAHRSPRPSSSTSLAAAHQQHIAPRGPAAAHRSPRPSSSTSLAAAQQQHIVRRDPIAARSMEARRIVEPVGYYTGNCWAVAIPARPTPHTAFAPACTTHILTHRR